MNNNRAIHRSHNSANVVMLQEHTMMIDVIRFMTVRQRINKNDGWLIVKIDKLVSKKPYSINDLAFELKMSRSSIQAKIHEFKSKLNTKNETINGNKTLIVRSVDLVMDYVPTGIQAKDLLWKKQ